MQTAIIEEFYQTYPSNAFRRAGGLVNDASTFGVDIEPPLQFGADVDEWEVGMTEIFAPWQHTNISKSFSRNILELRKMPDKRLGEKKLVLTAKETTDHIATVNLLPGLYDEESFSRIVNSVFVKAIRAKLLSRYRSTKDATSGSEAAARLYGEKLASLKHFYFIKYKAEAQRFRLLIPPRFFLMCYNEHLQRRMGWAKFDEVVEDKVAFFKERNIDLAMDREGRGRRNATIFANPLTDRSVGILLPEPSDFSRDNNTLFVYCNLVKSSLVGNVQANLLRMVDLGRSSAIKSTTVAQIYRSYPFPQYHKLKHARFESVEFQLCNSLGDPFPFQSGSSTTIVLHFRRIQRIVKKQDTAEERLIL